ncbi:hypothetical protein N9137_02165 [Pseudomonadales bacterium]|nr:hypothetical protein [Pseudomonadales bacterium]
MNEQDTLERLYELVEQLMLKIEVLERNHNRRMNSLESQMRRMANSPSIPVVGNVSDILIENKLYFINGELNWKSNGVHYSAGS